RGARARDRLGGRTGRRGAQLGLLHQDRGDLRRGRRRRRECARRQPGPRLPGDGDGAAGRRSDRDLRQRVRQAAGRGCSEARPRRSQRAAVDHHRRLRLRAARGRQRAGGVEGLVRPRDHHAAARRALDAGGAGARARQPARGRARARSQPLAGRFGSRPADEPGRDPDRNGARGRARSGRDGAAAVRDVDRGQHGDLGSAPARALDPGGHRRPRRVSRPRRSRAGLGARARADLVHPGREPDRTRRARALPEQAGTLNTEVDTMATVAPIEIAQPREAPLSAAGREAVFETRGLTVSYGKAPAVVGVDLSIYRNLVTAIIGPSGCGKSTYLRSLNRMNDLIPAARVEGEVLYHGRNIYADGVDPVEVRRRIGMVFQKPNPFPKSIYDNVAWGLRVLGMKDDLDGRVERALTQAALWDEAKDRLKASALSLSGGQQQRLCIARAIAVEPDVVLMDEPASALDPIATAAIEQLMHSLKSEYTFVIVTHNMQQAARVADMTAFFSISRGEEGQRWGELVEYDATEKIFTA